MAECPYCGKECKVSDNAHWNADTYSQTVKAITECCGEIVNVQPVRSYKYSQTSPTVKVDDWGMERRKTK